MKQLTTEEREWLARQSSLLRDGVAPDVNSGVLERRRAGGLASVVFLSLVVGAGALALVGWSLLRLHRFAHAMGPLMLLALGAGVAAGLIALYWRGTVTLAAARLPYLPMWIVTTEQLIRVSGAGVTAWPIRDVTRIDVRKSRGGVSIAGTYSDGRRFDVSLGAAIYGGLTWPDGSSIARAMQTAAGVPTADAVSGLFASPPAARGARSPGGLPWRAIAAGAVVLVCIGGSFAYHFARARQARALMASGALSAEHEEEVTRSGEQTAPVTPSAKKARPPDAAPAAKPAQAAPAKRPGKARASRAGRRKARPAKRPRAQRTSGRLPRQIISRVVGRRYGAVRACYRKGLASNPGLSGRVRVKLVIGPSGAVTSARDAGSSLPDRRVVGCILGQMRRLRFPAPQGGSVAVVYPFVLSP